MKPKNAETKQNKKKILCHPQHFRFHLKTIIMEQKKIIVADTVLSDDEGMIGVKYKKKYKFHIYYNLPIV